MERFTAAEENVAGESRAGRGREQGGARARGATTGREDAVRAERTSEERKEKIETVSARERTDRGVRGEELIGPPVPPRKRWVTRRRFLQGLAGAAVAGAYGRWVESDWLAVTQTAVALPEGLRRAGVAPLRVLHLSDLHAYEPWVPWELITRAIELGLALKPDVICLTGDFVTFQHQAELAQYPEVLRPLAEAAPTFACLGNHDRRWPESEPVRAVLRAAGVELLYNRGTEIAVGGRRVQLTGVGDWWLKETRADAAFATTPARGDALRIVLNHNPDAKSALRAHDWDVMLSGHTHGGQIGIPGLDRLIAPVRDKRFLAGLYAWEGRQIFITRGVGNLQRARIFCRPEVSLLEIG